jgi:hypothetical protein
LVEEEEYKEKGGENTPPREDGRFPVGTTSALTEISGMNQVHQNDPCFTMSHEEDMAHHDENEHHDFVYHAYVQSNPNNNGA